MRVMRQSPDPLARMHTMTKRQAKSGTIDVKALLAADEEFLRVLGGHMFSASSFGAMNQRLDEGLAQFAGRPLAEAFPYLILDARYERVREAGVIVSQAVLIAIGIDWDGRRQVVAVELANRESR